MSDTAAQAVSTVPPRVTPSATMPVRIPWGDWFDQAVDHSTPLVEKAAEAGIAFALHTIPLGFFVEHIVTPKIIDSYVDMGLAAVKDFVPQTETVVANDGGVVSVIANLIVKNEPKFAAWVGGELEPMIKAALAKFGAAV